MTDYRQRLEEAALECAEEDQKGWGNMMLDAASEIDRLGGILDRLTDAIFYYEEVWGFNELESHKTKELINEYKAACRASNKRPETEQ